MDLYLIYKDNRHQIVKDPTEVDMTGAEILTRRLGVTCHHDRVIFNWMKIVLCDILDRVADVEMLPERLLKLQQLTSAFNLEVPVEIKGHWQIYCRLGEEILNKSVTLHYPG